jgi:hypothetical protein
VNACGTDDSTAPPPAPRPPAQPILSIDTPGSSAVVRQPFAVSGWAIDPASTQGSGIDVVHMWAYPASGAAPTFVGWAPVDWSRPDVASAFGGQFGLSGYGVVVRGLAPGAYTIVVYAHSASTGAFVASRTVAIRIDPSTSLTIDTPRAGATVSQGFLVAGWAADFAATSGGGVDVVHVYAYPLDTGGAPVFLGQAWVGAPRSDVARVFGPQFGSTGFNLVSPRLAPGRYQVVAYAHSVVAGTFTVASAVNVTLR